MNLDYLLLDDMSFDLSFIFSYDANVLKFGEGYAVAANTTQPEGSSTGEGSQFNPDYGAPSNQDREDLTVPKRTFVPVIPGSAPLSQDEMDLRVPKRARSIESQDKSTEQAEADSEKPKKVRCTFAPLKISNPNSDM